MIQPQVPLRLPCYDFTPIATTTLVGCLPKVSSPASGYDHSRGVTGGVYKARERIHRGVLIRDYYRFRLHVGEFQPTIRTEGSFEGLADHCWIATRCASHCRMCVALDVSAMMI